MRQPVDEEVTRLREVIEAAHWMIRQMEARIWALTQENEALRQEIDVITERERASQ